MSEIFKIAVVSDLHCRHSAGRTLTEVNTYLHSDIFPSPINRNPIESLKKVIVDRRLQADILLCPGDVTDKSDAQGLISGWNFLGQLKLAFSARQLAASLGNHDVDSHKLINPDKHAFDMVKRLEDFPTSDRNSNLSFWSNHFCFLEEDDFVLLIINSSFNHTEKSSAVRSQIETSTIQQIEQEILTRKISSKVKIALVHHHPMIHSNMDYKDSDFIDKSDELLSVLDQHDFDICIHGHKHDPRLAYKNSLAVFASGSFSSTMNLLDLKADNTFHLISVCKGQRKGTVESWIYSPKDGWKQKKDTYFPCHTGFGYRENINTLAENISTWFNSLNKEVIDYHVLECQFPNLIYLIPDDQKKLNDILLSRYQIKFIPDYPNIPETVSKLYS